MINIINPSELELKDESVVVINRVSKVITGGRRFRFNAVVAVGDGVTHVDVGDKVFLTWIPRDASTGETNLDQNIEFSYESRH